MVCFDLLEVMQYLGSFLCHPEQAEELIADSRQSDLLKHTLLSLSQHHLYQHIQHSWAHVIARSVCKCFLQMMEHTW